MKRLLVASFIVHCVWQIKLTDAFVLSWIDFEDDDLGFGDEDHELLIFRKDNLLDVELGQYVFGISGLFIGLLKLCRTWYARCYVSKHAGQLWLVR